MNHIHLLREKSQCKAENVWKLQVLILEKTMVKTRQSKRKRLENFIFWFLIYFVTGILIFGHFFGFSLLFKWRYASFLWIYFVFISVILALNYSRISKLMEYDGDDNWQSWVFGKNRKWFLFFLVLWLLLFISGMITS